MLGVVEHHCLDAGLREALGEDVAHAAAGHDRVDVLRRDAQVRRLGDHRPEVDVLRGEDDVDVERSRQLVGEVGQLHELAARQVRLGVDDEKRAPYRDGDSHCQLLLADECTKLH